jgi:hypothetical protein
LKWQSTSGNLPEQLSLALVVQMMNRQSGDDGVSRPRVGELVPEVVSTQLDQPSFRPQGAVNMSRTRD